nr:monovalent cation/H+ antiporter subunit A [Sneathiella sp.]
MPPATMIEQNLLLLLALLPFIGAVFAATLPGTARNAAALLSGLSLISALVVLWGLHRRVIDEGVVLSTLDWVPSIGLRLTYRIDGFALFFSALILILGLLIVLYARFYMAKSDPMPRFYAFLMLFTGAMTGIVISGNILMLVVYWELTSIMSFLLIGFWHDRPQAREGARTALIVTAGGGLCLLVAILLLGAMVDSYSLDVVLQSGDLIRAHQLYPVMLSLFLLGAFTKSAQLPFHFWLQGAMVAPTPVSAYLHSATMVKAGVFILIRFSPALGGTELWFHTVTGVGMATCLLGAIVALFRHDMKGYLAYSTISHLGLITALAGMGGPLAIFAAIFHIANHATFKAAMFMTAGIIDHETGTRDMRRLGGLYRAMPITSALAVLATAAMAGVPFFNGFLSKEMFLAESLQPFDGSLLATLLPWGAGLAAFFSVAYSTRFLKAVIFGAPATDLPRPPHEPAHGLRLPVELLVAVCLIVGIAPAVTLGPILNLAATSVLGPGFVAPHLYIWHGLTPALQISLAALGLGGIAGLLLSGYIARGPEGPPLVHRFQIARLYEWALLTFSWKLPRVVERLIGSEKLQPQLRLLIVLVIGFTVAALWRGLKIYDNPVQNAPSVGFALMWLVGAACALGAAWQAKYHRLAALVMLGGAGVITCLTFAWFSAPDLAVTQLLVEIVTTVLLLLGLRWLPKRDEEIAADKRPVAHLRRGRDFIIALIAGSGLAMIAYVMMTRPLTPSIGDWFLENAYHEGGGTNVVNVILVDFRAFDTFGEITVLVVVALTVYALLRRFRPSAESAPAPVQQRNTGPNALRDYLHIPSVIMSWMFPVLIVISAYLFFRGHDLPGGGFSAGVTLAIGFLLQYIASNVRWIESRLTVLPIRWMGIGLLIAGLVGLGALLFGAPFLTMHAQYIDVPLIGRVPAATALIFDLGVYAAVVGATVLMLIAIAHQTLRAARVRDIEEAAAAQAAEQAEQPPTGARAPAAEPTGAA